MHMTDLEREVADDEGFMPIPYRCTSGKLSIGWGRCMGQRRLFRNVRVSAEVEP